MTVPAWLAVIAALDDDALAALANRGLVRRAVREVDRVELVSADEGQVVLAHTGTPPATVRLLPGGPAAARCGCPVAGVCVHIVAACLWARGAAPAGITAAEGAAPAECAAETVLAPTVRHEVLGWDPVATMKAAGVAAVRRVAQGQDAAATDVRATASGLHVTWPGAPEVVVLPGVGFAGMLVAGTHGDVAERAAKLEAVVRVFAAHGRGWPWPDDHAGGVHPGQREAMRQVVDAVEAAVRAGLAHVRPDAAARLTGASQRARVEELPLLARLTGLAASQVARLAERDDDQAERPALVALAEAWALAHALAGVEGALPPALVGPSRGEGADAEVGELVPLAARWWTSASGARGLTVTFLDEGRGRIETVTTGRAAGTDPTFTPSWTALRLWNASAEVLCRGPLRVLGAERRDDGTLAPTSRTRVEPLRSWAGVDLDRLAERVAAATTGPDAVGFGRRPSTVRMIRPGRWGLGTLTLDEVAQQSVWSVREATGTRHALRMAADGPEAEAVTQLLVRRARILAIIATDNRPDAVFTGGPEGVALQSLTLSPLGWVPVSKRRDAKVRTLAGAAVDDGPTDPLLRLCDAVLDACEGLASTGRATLTPRQADSLARRADAAAALGLASMATSARELVAAPGHPGAVLRATFLATRTRALAEGSASPSTRGRPIHYDPE